MPDQVPEAQSPTMVPVKLPNVTTPKVTTPSHVDCPVTSDWKTNGLTHVPPGQWESTRHSCWGAFEQVPMSLTVMVAVPLSMVFASVRSVVKLPL